MKIFNLKEITWYEWLGVFALFALIAVQLFSLYHTPIHDSYLWWGDESWLMNEYRTQLSTGVFRYPQAYGSTLNIGNPFPFTSMWITSIFYGIAGSLSPSNLIDAGRTLTAFFSIGLLVTVFIASRKLGASILISLLAVTLLASSRTFFLTSHSARYDILTSIAITAGVLYLLTRREEILSSKKYLALGAIWAAGLLISVHVSILLLLPVSIFLLRSQQKLSAIASFAIGAALFFGLLYLIHGLTQPALTEADNLQENLNTIPILRPFSRSVQLANLEQKLSLIKDFANVAGGALILLSIGFFRRDRNAKFSAVLLILPCIGWLAFQSAGPSSYLIHFLPCLIIGAALTVNSIVTKWPVAGRTVTVFTIFFAVAVGIGEGIAANDVGKQLTSNNRTAVNALVIADEPVIALNPAISALQQRGISFSTAHFIELPSRSADRLNGKGMLLTYNSGINSGFMWEVVPLRASITSPNNVIPGYFLDVGRSYFEPLSGDKDTLFIQRINVSELYTQHIR